MGWWDKRERERWVGGRGEAAHVQVLMIQSEWLKVQIIEYRVIGSLRRSIRQYRLLKRREIVKTGWNRYSEGKWVRELEEGGSGQSVEWLKFRFQRWSSSRRWSSKRTYGHRCVPWSMCDLLLPSPALYTCSQLCCQPEQTYSTQVSGGKMRARVHLGPGTSGQWGGEAS